ncbi:MAG: hypothetical protein VB064_01750 [Oscillospiraceae bacterium]|nr:hypothetical protein [Oscillospiraceae bacterium]
MKKKHKNEKTSPVNMPPFINNYTYDQCVNIQAEAYYRALKRIESEKHSQDQIPDAVPLSRKDKVRFFINIFFRPKKLKIKKGHLADSLLLIVVTMILDLIGFLLRLIAVFLFAYSIYSFVMFPAQVTISILYIVISILLAFLGGVFIASSVEIENGRDYNKLYAYSASIMSVLAVIIAAIALLIR